MDLKATKLLLASCIFLFGASANSLVVQNINAGTDMTIIIAVSVCLFLVVASLFFWHFYVSKNRREASQLKILWKYVPDIITVIDSNGKIKKVNRSFTGFRLNEIIGRDSREFLTPEGIKVFERALQQVVETGVTQSYELKVENQDGSFTWIKNQIIAVSDKGYSDSFLVLSSDVTKQKEAHSVLVKERARAEQANKAKSSFLANMSHEIRTPMTGMLGMASILEQTDLNAEQQECVRTIQSSAEHLLAVVNDVLDLSKIEADKLEIEHESFSLSEAITTLLDMTSNRAREKGLSLQSFIDPAIPDFIISDSVRLKQILMNYLTNAIKFTMKGHVILRVVILQRGASTIKLRLSVEDTGLGMPAEKAAHIFDEFTDAHGRMSTLVGGSGLGLNICRRLAEMMGGQVGVVSTPDLGSSFWLDLEVAIASCDTEPASGSSATKGLAESFHADDEVAWIMDEVKVNRLLAKEVARRMGFKVQEFNEFKSIQAALSGQEPPALLIFPHSLGEKRIQQLIDQVQSVGQQTYLALTTVESMNLDYDALVNKGVHAYWEWPIGQEELTSMLKRLFLVAWKKQPDVLVTRFARSNFDADSQHSYRGAILLVEDNLVNQKVAAQMLRKMGCEVDVAEDGQQALAAWKRNHYDLILMDCHMPVMDGLQATRMIRSQENNGTRTPILALTADVISDRKEDCEKAGMDGFMSKPIRMEELRNALSGYLHH